MEESFGIWETGKGKILNIMRFEKEFMILILNL